MKVTHKLTYLPTGGRYLSHVHGDEYYLITTATPYPGPFRGFRANFVYDDKWLVEKINTFKGNK